MTLHDVERVCGTLFENATVKDQDVLREEYGDNFGEWGDINNETFYLFQGYWYHLDNVLWMRLKNVIVDGERRYSAVCDYGCYGAVIIDTSDSGMDGEPVWFAVNRYVY